MSVVGFMKQIWIFVAVVLFSFFITSCAQQQASVEDPNETPVDSMNVDGRVDGMQSNGDGSGMDGSESSSANEISRLEQQLHAVNFKFDQFDIDGDMEDLLSENSEKVNGGSFENKSIKLEGNCDEWGSDEYNYALGLKRARAAKDYMVSEGVDKTRISIISFGESNPVCSDKTKACWSKNRRVDTKLLP